MTTPSVSLSVHNRYTPEIRDRILAKLQSSMEQINAFEKHLAENDVTILKFFLHISKEEQARRLSERVTDPTKRWKVTLDDITERDRWDDYMTAYEIALKRCTLDRAPWFIVPADRRWY